MIVYPANEPYTTRYHVAGTVADDAKPAAPTVNICWACNGTGHQRRTGRGQVQCRECYGYGHLDKWDGDAA